MADIFDVIADGTRRDILRLLLDRDSDPHSSGTSVSQIVSELGVSQPTISDLLRRARLDAPDLRPGPHGEPHMRLRPDTPRARSREPA